jgi:membrane protein DedA with SNARE-associated domain
MTGLIEQFGALGVFLLIVPESACIPVPSELTLIFSGFAVHQGWMSFPLAVLAATAGNVAQAGPSSPTASASPDNSSAFHRHGGS